MGRKTNNSINYKLVFCIVISFSPLSAQILLNEIMIDPDNDNTGEYIEIYNAGDSLADMSTFLFCDAQDTDAVIPFPDSLLLPGHYGLILDPDYSHDYDQLIPDSIPRFTIADSRFGMYGISNSTEKPFSILFHDHQISDSYLTGSHGWPDAGYSIERIRTLDSLWLSSLDIPGTPGFRNSVSPKDHEMRIASLDCIVSGDILCISFVLQNIGLQEIEDISYGYIVDISQDHPELNDTLIFCYNDAGRADGTGADADLECVAAGFDQRLGRLGSGDIAADQAAVREVAPGVADRVQHAAGMGVRGIDHDYVGAGIEDRLGARLAVGSRADCSAHAQTAAVILARIGMGLGLFNIFDRDQSLEEVVMVDNQQFFNAGFV